MRILSVVLLIALGLPGGAFGKTKGKSGKSTKHPPSTSSRSEAGAGLITAKLGGKEIQFFQDAFALGALASWLGGEAKARGEADRVKALGEALQETQIEQNQLLVQLAKKKGLILAAAKTPSQPLSQAKAQLASLEGAEFDAAILEQILEATQREADIFARAVESTNPDVKRFAEQTSATVNDKLILTSRVSGKPLPPGAKPGFRESAPVPAESTPASAPAEKSVTAEDSAPPAPLPATPVQ